MGHAQHKINGQPAFTLLVVRGESIYGSFTSTSRVFCLSQAHAQFGNGYKHIWEGEDQQEAWSAWSKERDSSDQ